MRIFALAPGGKRGEDERVKTSTYSVEDEHGNFISQGLESYSVAEQVAKRYLSAHKDAPVAVIYNDGVESWEVTLKELNS